MCAVRDASLREPVGEERAGDIRTEHECVVSCTSICKEISKLLLHILASQATVSADDDVRDHG